MKRVNPLPTLLTLCNLLCGFGAVTLALRAGRMVGMLQAVPDVDGATACAQEIGRLHMYAVLLVFLAMIFDVFDGRVARMAGLTSRFGAHLDSLSDVVSFGVAPAVLVKTLLDLGAYRGNWPLAVGRIGWVMLALYVAAAAVRLARYNVEAVSPSDGSVGQKSRNYFVGLPAPAAAGTAVSPVLLYYFLTEKSEGLGIDPRYAKWLTLLMPLLMILLAWLMVSRVRYMHLGNRLFSGRQRLWPVMLVVLGVAFLAAIPQVAGTVFFGSYVAGFLVWDLVRRARSARARRGLRKRSAG